MEIVSYFVVYFYLFGGYRGSSEYLFDFLCVFLVCFVIRLSKRYWVLINELGGGGVSCF